MMSNESAGRVLGLGGVFFLAKDPQRTLQWYQEVLGLEPNEYGGFDFLHGQSAGRYPQAARTIVSAFSDETDYLKPSALPYMLNFMVDDLNAMLVRAEAAGATQLQPRENTDYGDFAWFLDPDGRKVELWEPKEPREG